jgi:hypothetical protein
MSDGASIPEGPRIVIRSSRLSHRAFTVGAPAESGKRYLLTTICDPKTDYGIVLVQLAREGIVAIRV